MPNTRSQPRSAVAAGDAPPSPETLLALADWRRRMADLYAEIRSCEAIAGWTRWRAVRDSLFRQHPQSPLDEERRRNFHGLAYYDYDPSLRLLTGLVPVPTAAPFTVEAGKDGPMTLLAYARTTGLTAALGGELTLYWISGYGGGTFLPFRDGTCGNGTYAGGRYLLDTIKSADLGVAADGRLVLDFNFAYCPSCAYSPLWTCPLAPYENRLSRPVRAGERDG